VLFRRNQDPKQEQQSNTEQVQQRLEYPVEGMNPLKVIEKERNQIHYINKG
jgi:hypothetical protein